MPEIVATRNIRFELDRAFEYSVILSWAGLIKLADVRSVRVEYLCEPKTTLDHLSLWSGRTGGYQNLICNYWTWASSDHPAGLHFEKLYDSDQLVRTLGFIMGNQALFTRAGDSGRHGLVLIHPPDAGNLAEATRCMGLVESLGSNAGPGEGPESPLAFKANS